MNKLKILIITIFISLTGWQVLGQGTTMPIGPQANTFSSMVRGYYFTAPTDFVICSLYVADDASTAAQSIEVVRFNAGPPPAFAGTTNNFVSLFYQANYAPNTPVACNIQVNAGDVIGIYGARGNGQVNSYNGVQHNTTIDGFPVTLFRSGMQASLAVGQMANIWSENNYNIGRIFMTYNCCDPPEEPTSATAAPSTVNCGDNTTLTVNSANPLVSPPYQWVWYQDSCGGTPIDSGEVVTVQCPAQTQVTYYVRAEGPCDTSDCVGVTVNIIPPIGPYWAAPGTLCQNDDPIDLDALVTNGSSGTWSGVGVTGNFFDPSGGTQDVTYTTGAPPCEFDSTITIVVNPVPVVDPVADIDVCAGDNIANINFTSTPPGATFDWFNDNTDIGLGANGSGNIPGFIAQNPTENMITGTVSVVPTLNGCEGDTLTFNINVNGDFTADWTPPATLCEADAPINLDNLITGTTGGTWSGNGVTGNMFDPSGGTQSITYTAGVAPCEVTLTQDIDVNPTPTANPITDVVICSGETVTPIMFTSTPAGATFDWTNNAPSIGLNANGSGDIGSFTGTNNTQNDVVATITYTPTLNGCEGDPETFTITVKALPLAPTVNDTLICKSSSASLTATAPGGSYEWFDAPNAGNSIGLGATYDTPILENSASYYVETTVNGCTSPRTEVIVTVVPDIVVNAGPDHEVCDGESVTLTATGASTYSWNNGITNGVPFTPTTSGTYIVVGTSDLGCVNSDTVEIIVNPMPQTNFSTNDLSGCAPHSVAFTNLTSNLGANDICKWEFGDGTVYNGCDLAGRTYQNPGCYDVSLTVTTEHGCQTKTKYDSYVCVNPSPIANFNFDPATPTTVETVITFNNFSDGATEYSWIFGDMGTSEAENPVLEFPKEEGEYKVTLIAENEYGCTDTSSSVLTIFGELLFYVPNAFTPDGDGFNETFLPVMTSGFDPYNYRLLIFSRWGEVVFESQNPNVGWDGTFRGEVVSDGVYIWQIEFKETIADKRQTRRGHVTVIR